ncbi:MAG TPA: PilZ domain-containing protein [Gammaproteobacteria bacterium]|nr:PilZ domain-containing protein [Gammaproteobacteria bacterium]
MEHRCSVRKAVEFQLLLYRQGLPVQNAVSRDLGLGGMCIQTGACDWRRNERLEIEILGPGCQPVMKLPAVVVHHSLRGTGVEFDAVSAEQRRILRAWLYTDRPETEAEPAARAVA